MVKLILCGIIIVILFKKLLSTFNNLTNDIKYGIKEKEIQKQEILRQQEIKMQEEIQRQEELRQIRSGEYAKEENLEYKNTSIYKTYREGLDIKYIKKLRQKEKEIGFYNSYREGLDIEFIKRLRQKEKNIRYRERLYIETLELSCIDRLDNGYEFEDYVANLLEKLGYCNIEVTQSSGDYGADVLAEKTGITYAIQCKWSSLGSNNIGNKAVQEIYSAKAFYEKGIRNSCNK